MSFDASFFDPKQHRHTLRIAPVRELHNTVDGAERGTASDQISLQLLQQADWRGFAETFLRQRHHRRNVAATMPKSRHHSANACDQYRQLVVSAPAGAVFSSRSRIFGANIW
jgi:hypothetical protein